MVELQSEINIKLPEALTTGNHSLEQLLSQRRSVREYQNSSIALAQLAQLLWAAQGITHPQGLRTAPSAGALYPLEMYVAVNNVTDLEPFVYHYHPKQHRLQMHEPCNVNRMLTRAAYGQSSVRDAAAVVVFTANYERSTVKYHIRGARYAHIEAGHAAENLFLQAQALELKTVVVGAFFDDEVTEVLRLPRNLTPLLLMPVGHGKK